MTDGKQSIVFLNTKTNRKEIFQPMEPGKVKMYACGPTIYDYAHIGNLRTFLFVDILRRYLEFRGFEVEFVMNLTDVEDKIIKASKEKGVSIFEYTQQYEQAFFEDIDTLKIKHATHHPKATGHIDDIVEMIRTLREKGFTYEKDGSIYYRISSFDKYGKLSGVTPESTMAGARVDADEYEKDDPRDFVLWKAHKKGEHYWDTELGPGRPGWHIECSVMSTKYLGNHFDIHCGGEDLIFPHHENEIAQSEACTGEEFVNYWLHCRHLLVEGEKMSKSKGNFYTLRELLNEGHNPMAIRFYVVSSHYRSPLNFTQEGLRGTHNSWNRIMDFHQRIKELIDSNVGAPKNKELEEVCESCLKQFIQHMDDDLDTPRACAVFFDTIRDANRLLDEHAISSDQAQEVLDLIHKIDSVIGMIKEEEVLLDEEIEQLIEERQEARKHRDFAKADSIRDRLAEQGILLEDTRGGVRWKRR